MEHIKDDLLEELFNKLLGKKGDKKLEWEKSKFKLKVDHVSAKKRSRIKPIYLDKQQKSLDPGKWKQYHSVEIKHL